MRVKAGIDVQQTLKLRRRSPAAISKTRRAQSGRRPAALLIFEPERPGDAAAFSAEGRIEIITDKLDGGKDAEGDAGKQDGKRKKKDPRSRFDGEALGNLGCTPRRKRTRSGPSDSYAERTAARASMTLSVSS